MNDMEKVELRCCDGPWLRFTARLLAETTTQRPEGKPQRPRWEDIRLWETANGTWIAELTGCSDEGSERDLVQARVIEASPNEFAQKVAALDHWGWRPHARAMVRQQLKWDMVRDVE